MSLRVARHTERRKDANLWYRGKFEVAIDERNIKRQWFISFERLIVVMKNIKQLTVTHFRWLMFSLDNYRWRKREYVSKHQRRD